jgi:hypothetical protein
METRKIEIWSNGDIGYADQKERTNKTRLGEVAIPLLSEIAKDPEFQPSEISKNEFEKMWINRKRSN